MMNQRFSNQLFGRTGGALINYKVIRNSGRKIDASCGSRTPLLGGIRRGFCRPGVNPTHVLVSSYTVWHVWIPEHFPSSFEKLEKLLKLQMNGGQHQIPHTGYKGFVQACSFCNLLDDHAPKAPK